MQPEQSVTHRDYEQLVLNQPRSMPPQLMCVARLQGACAPFILQSTNKAQSPRDKVDKLTQNEACFGLA